MSEEKGKCIFCKIIRGEVPASTVYEDEKVISFLDIMPANKGHCLIVPKTHYPRIEKAPEELLAHMMIVAKKLGKAQSLAMGTKSYNLLLNNGEEAGQVVEHIHLHVIPRFNRKRLKLDWNHLNYKEGEMSEVKNNIKKFM